MGQGWGKKHNEEWTDEIVTSLVQFREGIHIQEDLHLIE